MQPMTRRTFVGLGAAGAGMTGFGALGWDLTDAVRVHWRDIKNADVILINGANPAEAHPVGFQWFLRAKLDPARGPGNGGGARIIHVDPRFTRTSAVADIHARIRVGTDAAFFGGLIHHVLEHDLIHRDYVRDYTNASFLVENGSRSTTGCSAATTRTSAATTQRRGPTRPTRLRRAEGVNP